MTWTTTKKALFVLTAIASLTVSANTASANLLSNGSFESVLEYADPNLPNWFAFFGAGSTGTFSTVDPGYMGMVMPSVGANNLSIANDGTPDGFSGVLQAVAGSAGLEYTFSFDAKSNSGPSFPLGAEFRIEWLDDGGVIGDTGNIAIAGSLTEQYQQFSVTATAPVGTTRVQPVIAVETFSANGSAGNLFVDNTVLTAVPEPATAGLLSLASVALFCLRRRS
ncbi:MAG: PEP-CTERM sorting domain-containing protein [Planctomycetota bacterium]